jgi:hypothetical protein
MLSRVGSRLPKLTNRTIKRRETMHIKKQDHAQELFIIFSKSAAEAIYKTMNFFIALSWSEHTLAIVVGVGAAPKTVIRVFNSRTLDDEASLPVSQVVDQRHGAPSYEWWEFHLPAAPHSTVNSSQ